MKKFIDINFDFRTDTPKGKDPDSYSPTLRLYHKLLWSKQLPNGSLFTLQDTHKDCYLYHSSEMGEFHLSSDSAIHTFSRWKSMSHIVSQVNEVDIESFRSLGYTIGGMIIFPSNKVDGKSTINGARGFNSKIRDRIDLTLECIRRYYLNEDSPLEDVLLRYSSFFEIFGDFQGYIEFFLLQDLVSVDFNSIKFFIPFDNFKTSAIPLNLDMYTSYKENVMNFINLRNTRIALASD